MDGVLQHGAVGTGAQAGAEGGVALELGGGGRAAGRGGDARGRGGVRGQRHGALPGPAWYANRHAGHNAARVKTVVKKANSTVSV